MDTTLNNDLLKESIFYDLKYFREEKWDMKRCTLRESEKEFIKENMPELIYLQMQYEMSEKAITNYFKE